MRTPRPLLLPVAAAAAVLLGAPPDGVAATTGRWFPTQGFTASSPRGNEPVPRAAIARDGTSAVAFHTQSGALLVATGTANGRFGAPRIVDGDGASDWSIAAAPGGAFLVAWEDVDGLHAAVRTKAGHRIVQRRYDDALESDINGVQVAADPQGGWVIARRVFPRVAPKDRSYGVRALSLDAAGRRVGAVADLGRGYFGIDARPTQALAVGSDGRAVLAFTRDAPIGIGTSESVVVATRPHGGAFGPPVSLPGPRAADPRVATDPDGRALVAFTQVARRGDAGSSGAPAVSTVRPDGTLGRPLGPALPFPRRAFGPSAALWPGGASLVFQLKTKSDPFATEAPVRAVSIGTDGTIGALQTLTTGLAEEPFAVGLSRGRALVVWSGRRGIGASLATDGAFARTAAPNGPPPSYAHFNSTNRDLRAAGRFAIFTWARAGRVRVAVRGF